MLTAFLLLATSTSQVGKERNVLTLDGDLARALCVAALNVHDLMPQNEYWDASPSGECYPDGSAILWFERYAIWVVFNDKGYAIRRLSEAEKNKYVTSPHPMPSAMLDEYDGFGLIVDLVLSLRSRHLDTHFVFQKSNLSRSPGMDVDTSVFSTLANSARSHGLGLGCGPRIGK